MLTDGAFLEALQSANLPAGSFDHQGHVRAAWLYLKANEEAVAIEQFVASIKHLVKTLGAEDKYHETITRALMHLIAKRMQDEPTWEAFCEREQDLMHNAKAVLLTYYTEALLFSDKAKHTWQQPDIKAF